MSLSRFLASGQEKESGTTQLARALRPHFRRTSCTQQYKRPIAMAGTCCVTGSLHEGTPKGEEVMIGGLHTYVAKASSPSVRQIDSHLNDSAFIIVLGG